MLAQSSDDIAYLLGDFVQQPIDGCDIGAVDPAHATPNHPFASIPIHAFGRAKKRFEPSRAVAANDELIAM
jgi:hypothetical protein